MKITAVVMAGGKGERFWPRSRRSMPKQFLCLTDDGKTMIQHTVERLKSMVNIEEIFVVTNQNYQELVKQQLPEIPDENILLEPFARNTAPCVGLAAIEIRKRFDDAVMIVLPSDHLIKYNEIFLDTLKEAAAVAEAEDSLVTIGITPSSPETGYGYINFGRDEDDIMPNGVYRVKRFVEKPDLETAKDYLASGRYLWNSGMFVWKASTILKAFEQLLPDIYEGLLKIEESLHKEYAVEVLKEQYNRFESESIDYGIMERATNIYTIPGSFGWDDVGNWLSLDRIRRTNDEGNIIDGNVITIKTKNTIVQGQEKLIALVGMEDVIVVDADDAILICSKDNTQDVKKVIENLKICNRNEYL